MKDLVIVKLGGSVLTDKSKGRGAFRKGVVRRIAEEIVQARQKKPFDLILVHGAGAYPHYLTRKYTISEGFKDKNSAFGFAHIKKELFRLNNQVWAECLAVGLVVCTVQPSAVVFTSGGRINSFDVRLLESLISMGIVPLLMGEDSIDDKKGIAILSGDRIVAYLGKKYRAKKIVFVSDVGGVYDKNPKVYPDAKLISEINNKNFELVARGMKSFNKNDVSGEMKGKILAIKEDLTGLDVQIVSGFVKGALKNVLVGAKFSGTKFSFKLGH